MTLLAARFRETASKSKDYRMKVETEFSVGHSTGFLNFDFMNGTVIHVKSPDRTFSYNSIGVTDGSMCLFIGRSGSGKTTLCIQMAANIIRPFKTSCMFYDNIEGGIIDARLEKLTRFGKDLRERCIMRNTSITAENFYERIKMVHDIKMEDRASFEYDTGYYDFDGNRIYKLEPTVYILDSLALLMPDKFTSEDDLSGSMSATAAAKTNAGIFKRVIPLLKAANIILFIINHINQKVDINKFAMTKSQVGYLKQGETLPGGNTPIYVCNTMIRVDDNTKLKDSEGFGINGSLVDLTIIKSRSARAGKSCTVVFDQENGFDPELSLFIMLKNANRVKGAGAYLYLGDRSDIKFAQKHLKSKLRENEEFRDLFMTEVLQVLQESINENSNNALDLPFEDDLDISSSILDKLKTAV